MNPKFPILLNLPRDEFFRLLACAINLSFDAEIRSDAWIKYLTEFKFRWDIEIRS